MATGARLGGIVPAVVRLALVALLLLSAYELVAPESFRIEPGVVTVRVVPQFGGGETIMPLGPVGRVRFDTHDTPLNVEVSFVFDDSPSIGSEARALLGDLPSVGATAADALRAYAVGKTPWICTLGLAAGALVAGIGPARLRRTLLGTGIGLLAIWAILGLTAGATYAGLDRRPAASFDGLARYAPRIVSLLQGVVRHPKAARWSVDDLARGLEEVARQAGTTAPVGSGDADVVRLLVAGDVHDNVIGYRLIRRLASDPRLSVAGVVLVGDLTHAGTAPEADLILGELKPLQVPVAMVGGNHEAAPAMRRFSRGGIVQLSRGPVRIGGLTLMGFDDPLADEFDVLTAVAGREAAAAEALAAVRAEVPPPQIVVFHDGGQAEDVVAWAAGQDLPLTVLHGHDHEAVVEREGSVVILDPGSGGASGFEQLGRDPGTPYTFQIVEFVREPTPRPIAVITLQYEGLAGASTATYQPLPPAQPAE